MGTMNSMELHQVYALADRIIAAATPVMTRLGWSSSDAAIGDNPDVEVALAVEAYQWAGERIPNDLYDDVMAYLATIPEGDPSRLRIEAAIPVTA